MYLRRLDQARLSYARALEIEPDDPRANRGLAYLLLQSGEFNQAASRLRPRDAEVHNNLGVALAQTGKQDEAREHFRQALSLRPGSVVARNDLARWAAPSSN